MACDHLPFSGLITLESAGQGLKGMKRKEGNRHEPYTMSTGVLVPSTEHMALSEVLVFLVFWAQPQSAATLLFLSTRANVQQWWNNAKNVNRCRSVSLCLSLSEHGWFLLCVVNSFSSLIPAAPEGSRTHDKCAVTEHPPCSSPLNHMQATAGLYRITTNTSAHVRLLTSHSLVCCLFNRCETNMQKCHHVYLISAEAWQRLTWRVLVPGKNLVLFGNFHAKGTKDTKGVRVR